MSRFFLATFLVLLMLTVPVHGQREQAPADTPTPPQPLAKASNAPRPVFFSTDDSRRACEGCPPRSVGKAIWHTTFINIAYEMANLIRGQVTARITPKTWWDNMEQGWVWDLDDFTVNQIGHPYQGNNYFNAGRSNGLSFYESAALAAFGSATWEYFGETNAPSLNDLLNTTLGGIALGEMFHRTAWLVRNTQATGKGRMWNEIGAAVLDPVTGANRFITGDASRVMEKPEDMVPSALSGLMSAGVLWRGSETRAIDAAGQPFFEFDGIYGRPNTGSSRTAYDAFAVRLRFGGGAGFSEARVRGRLLGQPLRRETVQFSVFQSYDYQANDAYHFGAQSFEAALGANPKLGANIAVALIAFGGPTVLGAVDSIPLDDTGQEETPDEPEESAGQGISEGPRYYDFGPGWNFGGSAIFTHRGAPFATTSYEGRHLYSLDGVRANHFLQRIRLDLTAPLKGRFGVGASGEYFIRHTFYKEPDTKKEYHYPQVRLYFTWSLS